VKIGSKLRHFGSFFPRIGDTVNDPDEIKPVSIDTGPLLHAKFGPDMESAHGAGFADSISGPSQSGTSH